MIQQLLNVKALLLFIIAAWLSGCAAPEPRYGGPAPVVDRSTLYQPPSPQTDSPQGQNNNVQVTTLTQPQPLAPTQNYETPKPAPVQQPAPPPPAPTPTAAPPPPKNNQAVVALLDSAANYVGSGDLNKAAAALERALRIEPQNAGIWHDLGQIRLHQRQYSQAEAMFAKSNGLASQDRSLQARNWRMISKSRELSGDKAGADSAAAQATNLEN